MLRHKTTRARQQRNYEAGYSEMTRLKRCDDEAAHGIDEAKIETRQNEATDGAPTAHSVNVVSTLRTQSWLSWHTDQ